MRRRDVIQALCSLLGVGTQAGTCSPPAQRDPARLMDAGKRLSARAESSTQRGSWLNIQISLYLDDV